MEYNIRYPHSMNRSIIININTEFVIVTVEYLKVVAVYSQTSYNSWAKIIFIQPFEIHCTSH